MIVHASTSLIAIVEVDKADRIICQAEGCGHTVYKRIHVVRDNDRIKVVGSECYKRLYLGQDRAAQNPMYGSAEGRRLSEAERIALLENTERFIASLESEHIAAEKAKEARQLEAEAAERLQASARRTVPLRNPYGSRRRTGYGVPPVIDILSSVAEAELAQIRIEARRIVQASNPDVDLNAPGWSGLVEQEVRNIVRQRRKERTE